jgi:putative ABC transport system ATP-binding protein
MQLLDTLNREDGLSIVLITHEKDVAAHAGRRLFLRDGLLEAQA